MSAGKTPFNLAPCNNQLEVAMTQFLDIAGDVATFAKNAGPQALRIDYLGTDGRRAIYTPDFLVRKADGDYLLVETKGRVDRDVPAKARAAIEWCRAASAKKLKWEYVYVPEDVFEAVGGTSVEGLARACAPALAVLIRELDQQQLPLIFEPAGEERVADQVAAFIDRAAFEALPSRYRKAIEHAVSLFHFHEKKETVSFAPVFQPLLGPIDNAAEALLLGRLSGDVPAEAEVQRHFFEPDLTPARRKNPKFLAEKASLLKRLLVYRSPVMPTGLLSFCLDYAGKGTDPLPGVFTSIRERLCDLVATGLKDLLDRVYQFRNTYIAHEKHEPLKNAGAAREALGEWLRTLVALSQANRTVPIVTSEPGRIYVQAAEPRRPPPGDE